MGSRAPVLAQWVDATSDYNHAGWYLPLDAIHGPVHPWCGTILEDDMTATCRIGDKDLQFIGDMRKHAQRIVDAPSWRESQVCLERSTFGDFVTIM